MQSVLVTKYFIDLLADNGNPVLLIVPAGCGKTALMQYKLGQYGEDRMIVTSVSIFTLLFFHYKLSLEKKASRNYGPPGMKKLIYFLDDLNMREVGKYGTAQPHTILRQHLDYKHW